MKGTFSILASNKVKLPAKILHAPGRKIVNVISWPDFDLFALDPVSLQTVNYFREYPPLRGFGYSLSPDGNGLYRYTGYYNEDSGINFNPLHRLNAITFEPEAYFERIDVTHGWIAIPGTNSILVDVEEYPYINRLNALTFAKEAEFRESGSLALRPAFDTQNKIIWDSSASFAVIMKIDADTLELAGEVSGYHEVFALSPDGKLVYTYQVESLKLVAIDATTLTPVAMGPKIYFSGGGWHREIDVVFLQSDSSIWTIAYIQGIRSLVRLNSLSLQVEAVTADLYEQLTLSQDKRSLLAVDRKSGNFVRLNAESLEVEKSWSAEVAYFHPSYDMVYAMVPISYLESLHSGPPPGMYAGPFAHHVRKTIYDGTLVCLLADTFEKIALQSDVAHFEIAEGALVYCIQNKNSEIRLLGLMD